MSREEQENLFSRRSGKSASAFRTISEVAAELDVPTHVLRFWEGKFPNIKPLKRSGGRRYYRPDDVELLRRIRTLLYEEGYTIKGAQRLIREPRDAGGDNCAAPSAVGEHSPAGQAVADPGVQRELREVLRELRHLRDLLTRPTSRR